MHDDTNRQKIYLLLDSYIMGDIDEKVFCEEFYYLYDLGLDYTTLSELEREAFRDLNAVVSRFSPYAEDHALDSTAFSTGLELKEKIMKVKAMVI